MKLMSLRNNGNGNMGIISIKKAEKDLSRQYTNPLVVHRMDLYHCHLLRCFQQKSVPAKTLIFGCFAILGALSPLIPPF